jgi:hypothetical protein
MNNASRAVIMLSLAEREDRVCGHEFYIGRGDYIKKGAMNGS